MKRLLYYLKRMDEKTLLYTEMYDAPVFIDSIRERDTTYFRDGIGYDITPTDRMSAACPTVVISIPADKLQGSMENAELKRLYYYLKKLEENTKTYSDRKTGEDMYTGRVTVPPGTPSNPTELTQYEYDTTFFHGDIGLSISETDKLSYDKPTLVWQIPCGRLHIEQYTAAAADFCLRAFIPYIEALNAELYNRSRPDTENGAYYIRHPGGEVLVRNSAYFALCRQKDYEIISGCTIRVLDDGIPRPPQMCLCIRMQVQLPRGRLKKAIRMLCSDLPKAVDAFIADFPSRGLALALETSEKQSIIRQWMKTSDFCSFIANGSILPRYKDTDEPLTDAVPFKAPPGSEIEIAGIRGMGIKRGVTVITGGGYSGKTTLLDAVAAGIHDHIAGDGREFCITDETAVSISAEDGRAVRDINISPFVKWLPDGDTGRFSTDRASGSTSQAANIMEAVHGGSRLLMIDEDRSATNFMIRDKAMKELIEKEPLTPLTDRVRELAGNGVSTLLVIGGSGEYLGIADKVYRMDDFIISDVTDEAAKISGKFGITVSAPESADWRQTDRTAVSGWTSYPERSGSERMSVSELGIISIGDEDIDVRGLHDILNSNQLSAAAFIIRTLMVRAGSGGGKVEEKLDELYDDIADNGLDVVWSGFFTGEERFLDLPRKNEVMAVINRMRNVEWKI